MAAAEFDRGLAGAELVESKHELARVLIPGPSVGEVLPGVPPPRPSIRERGFNGLEGSALKARAAADRRAVHRAAVDGEMGSLLGEAMALNRSLLRAGQVEVDSAVVDGRRPDKDVVRRAERAIERVFDRTIGKPTQAVAVESRSELFVVLADVVRGVSGVGGG